MNKEQENQFKEHIKEMAREEIQRTFTDNLMEKLNSVFIFKYVETLELKCKKQKEIIDKTINAVDLVIELIKQQPTEDDRWILDRLNGFKIILEDKEVSE